MADTSKRGFASMDRERQREIASKGGRAAHAKGTAHEFTSDEARVAGRKGGESVSRNREHMSSIGRKGGESRSARNRDLVNRSAFSSTSSERGGSDLNIDRTATNRITNSTPQAGSSTERGTSDRSTLDRVNDPMNRG